MTTSFEDRFMPPDLDAGVWIASYLPAWSSQAESAATYAIGPDGLVLSIPPGQSLWCPDRHETPLRVSAVQSGNWSGPAGTSRGQQPFVEGLRVREAQSPLRGLLPSEGMIEVECRAVISPRSMFSAWMVGFEEDPAECGEICLVEVFGDGVRRGAGGPEALVGNGIHPFRDPLLREEFSAEPMPIDVADWHVYAVDWRPTGITWSVDGRVVRTSDQSPQYPMQVILGVFDFPERARAGEPVPTPELVVRRVSVRPA